MAESEAGFMSTVIDVYPSTAVVPTLAAFSDELHALLLEQRTDPVFVRSFGHLAPIDLVPKVERVSEMTNRKGVQRFCNAREQLRFTGEDYGWLSLPDVKAGFDFYYCGEEDHFDDLPHREIVEDYAARAVTIGTLDGFPFDQAAQLHWSWYMRLQIAQPLRTRLLAGYAAAALARITHGFIHSEDGGVDYDRAPTDPETFLGWYPTWIEHERQSELRG